MPEIGVDAALVELVEDDRVEPRQKRIVLKARGQNPLGGEEQARTGPERRSNRTCHPTSRPSDQPCSSAIRRATPRAATRRGCSTMTPAPASAGETRVVLLRPAWLSRPERGARERARRIARLKVFIGEGSGATGGFYLLAAAAAVT